MSLQTYLTNNNLNCVCWIDATDVSNINVIGSTFTAINKLNNASFDFIQPVLSNHPIYTGTGLKFSGTQHLYLRDIASLYSLFTTSSYTMLFITRGNPYITQDLISISKINPTLPKFLEVIQSGGKSTKLFSNLAVEEYSESDSYNGAYQHLALTQDIKLGISTISVNKETFITHLDINKGFITNNLPSVVMLGNNTEGVPYIGEIIHFLLFFPGISDIQTYDILNILQDLEPLSGIIDNSYSYNVNNYLNLSTNITYNTTLGYTLPIQIYGHNVTCNVDLTMTINLATYSTWDTLETSNWDNIEIDWDYLE